MRAEAERILAQHTEMVSGLDLDHCDFCVFDGVVAVYHPVTSPTAWMIHIAADKGTTGHKMFRGLAKTDEWFKTRHPSVLKLFGFIRDDNYRAMKTAAFMGFEPEGHIKDYLFQNGTHYGIIVMGRRQ